VGAQGGHTLAAPQAGPDGTKHPGMGPDVVRLCYGLGDALQKGQPTS